QPVLDDALAGWERHMGDVDSLAWVRDQLEDAAAASQEKKAAGKLPTPSAVLSAIIVLVLGAYLVAADVWDPGLLGHRSTHIPTLILGVLGIVQGVRLLLGMIGTPISPWVADHGTSFSLLFWTVLGVGGVYAIARGDAWRIVAGLLGLLFAGAMVTVTLKRSRRRTH
ncbi:MAG: hypothetical protein ABR511_11940, partial [Acidimicrobiales bacterium]